MSIEFLESDFDKVSYLVNILTARATGMAADSREFEVLRDELLRKPNLAPMLPPWLRQHRNLDSFWGFIQPKFATYSERRAYLSEQFTPVLDALEFGQPIASAPSVNAVQNPAKPVARNKRKVFIVHGMDNGVKQEVSRFIEKLGLAGR